MTLPSFGRPDERVFTHCEECGVFTSHDFIRGGDVSLAGEYCGYICRECCTVTETNGKWA